MVNTWVKAIAAIVLVSIFVLVVYYTFTHYQCKFAKERYEDAATTLSVTEIPFYLNEYQKACSVE